jgi:hypothetical protein
MPVALFETHDLDAAACQASRERCPCGPGADDHDVDATGLHHSTSRYNGFSC